MSLEKSNRRTDKSSKPSDRLNPQMRKDRQDTVNQGSSELNRNEESASPSGRSNPTAQSDLSTEPWKRETSSQLRGERENDGTIERSRNQYGVTNQVSTGNARTIDTNQRNTNPIEGNRAGRSYTANSERSGQQYSEEGNSSQALDWQSQQYHGQKKNQLDKSHGTEYSADERRKTSRGMNAPGMRNDQEMNHPRDRKNSAGDEKSDLKDGAE